ncbi:MAG: Tn3 family transposase [Solirubrobacteraceae bacterium]
MGYPNDAERRRLERFPDRIAVEDLRACFALSDRDRVLVFDQRGAENRLGLAVALCALRFLGFVPDDIASIPDEALVFVAGQVDAAPHELLAYGARAQTRSDHLQLVLAHLGWRRAEEADRGRLTDWLIERAVEHDAPATLMGLVSEHLRARRVPRPPVETLTRMIATARASAHRRVDAILADQLPEARRNAFDRLLDGASGQTSGLADLRGRAARTGVKEALGQVERYRRLVALGALEIDVSSLPPARRRALEAMGRRMTAQQIRRLEPSRRHPLVLVLLQALVIERGDELLDLFDKLLRLSDGRARRRVDDQRRKTARQRDELAALGQQLSMILLECVATGEVPFERVRSEVGLERLHAAAAIKPGQLTPIDEQQLDQVLGSYSHLRRAMHAILDAVGLRGATSADEELLAALGRVRAAHGRFVDEPAELLPKAWRAWVLDEKGRVQRTRLELGLWFVARDALRAGRLFRPVGRRYADPAAFLMPDERWQGDRHELAVTFGRTLDAGQRLRELEAEQQQAMRSLQAAVDAGDGVRLVAGRLELAPPDALHESPATVRLRAHLNRLTPHIDIPDLLAEVEGWTGFTGQLTHTAGATPRIGDLQQHLHAALLASGLNLGPTRMAECCSLSYRQLAWATEWYLGDEQLEAANDVLVDYLHQLQLAAHWGTGAFSSSDGQRSAARARAAAADPMAREFGFRRGALNLVNWVSDQYSQYGTKVVSVAEREAIHTLEAILHTQLPIAEHTTDTHGATELVFALFDLLGLSFIPRLRDAGDLRLHRLGEPTGLPVDVVLRSRARPARIIEQYDQLLRTAASLKRGWVPASLLITRLKNATPQTPLAAALAEYGRIVRTNFLLLYCADPALRARIAGQLNKGETLHALRRHLVIGSRAQIPANEDDHRRHALSLQILVNAVQIWNARYMTASIEHLHTTKPDVVADEDALARVAPVTHAHVNSLGRYDLNRQPPPRGQLRPLRPADHDADSAVPTPPLGVSGDKH